MSLKNNLMTSAAALALMTGAAIAQTATDDTATTEQNAEYAQGWNEDLDQQYGDIADRQIAELIGMNVVSDNGDDVGEVDNFVLMEDELKAVVGVGGFLGLGEHEVAISLSDMTYNGENLVIAFTKEELESMPEYTEELEAMRLAETDTLRNRQMNEDGEAVETAAVEGATGGMDAGNTEGEELAEGDEATIETDETAGEATAEAEVEAEGEGEPMETASADGEGNGDMEATGDGNAEMAGTQSVDAEAEAEGDAEMAEADGEMNIDEEQTAEADTMEEVDAEAEGEMTAEVDPGTDEDASPTGEEVAAAEEAAGDEDTMTEEVAENEQGEIEQEAEELTAEAEAATEEAGEEMADAAEATENAVEDAGDEVAEAGEAVEAETEETMAEAENAVEGAADEASEEMAEAGEATENAVEEAGEEVAQAGEEAEAELEGAATETAAAAEEATDEAGDWMTKFSDIASWQINEIEGTDVASADGNVIGEIDDMGRQDGKIVALVGIGGFLGLGEHDVALSMENLSWDGEKFITEGYSEEELKAMAEYDAETVEMLEDDTTLESAM